MVVRRSAPQRSGDKNVSQTPFKPICVQYGFGFFVAEKSKSVSSAAGRPGFQGAALNRFCILLSAQKDAPAGQAYRLEPFVKLSPPIGDISLLPNGSRGLGRGTAIGRETPPQKGAYIFHYNFPCTVWRCAAYDDVATKERGSGYGPASAPWPGLYPGAVLYGLWPGGAAGAVR